MFLKEVAKYVLFPMERVRIRIKIYIWLTQQKNSFFNRIWIAILKNSLFQKHHIIISANSHIKSCPFFPHPQNIVIGLDVFIGEGCTIYQDVTIGQNRGKFPKIGNGVIIYAGAKIIGDIYIGDGAVIGANAVVVDDVPDNAIVGGVPAKVIKLKGSENDFY